MSPTFALVGVINNLGPFGAAKQGYTKEKAVNVVGVGRENATGYLFCHTGCSQIQFPFNSGHRARKRALKVFGITGLCQIYPQWK